jgi:hypothetical protein
VRKYSPFIAIALSFVTAAAFGGGAEGRVKTRPTTTTTMARTTTTTTSTTTTTAPPTTTTTTIRPTTTTTTVAPAAPSASAHFSTVGPGSALPSDATCASRVRHVSENRPGNATPNATVPSPGSFSLKPLTTYYGYDNRSQNLEGRVTGNFTGTTDEIIQWASCKWGFDEDVVRAIAATESWWNMSQLGDFTSDGSKCPPGYSPTCPRSFGIHQVTWNSDPMGTYPWSKQSTAFNLDASLLIHRICYEGYTWWLRDVGYTSYAAGDMWGCVGEWYSGWYDSGAQSYNAKVQNWLSSKPWTQPGF